MRLKNWALSVLVCMGAVACRASYADTLTLTGTPGDVVNGVYVYPYEMSVNGAAQSTAMMCINYNDHITQNETWQVTAQQLSTSSSTALQEDAWLFSQVSSGAYSDGDIQFAVWDVLYPSINSSLDTVSENLISLAQQAVPGLTNSFLNRYMVYVPVNTAAAQSTWTDGLPQTFITNDPMAVTPEPSSLVLLGSGLLGASLLVVRRRAFQQQHGGSLA